MVRRPVGLVREVLDQFRLHEVRSWIRQGLELAQGRTDEEFEADQRAHRVARQAEDQRLVPGAEEQRFAGLHFHLVKVSLDAEFLEDAGHQVEFACRHAAGKNEDIRIQSARRQGT